MTREIIKLFLAFAKIGAVTFGGGYAMLPILQKDIVKKHGWATDDELPVVRYAFNGIRVCVCILILNAVLKLSKSSLVDKWTSGIFAVVFILSMFFNISAAILVLAAGLAGYIIKHFAAKEESGK